MKVTEIDIKIAQTRDHQVVNDHRHGTIVVHISVGMANTHRKLCYGFAKKTTWLSHVITDDHPGMQDTDVLRELNDEVIAPELAKYGFTTQDKPPDWHYTQPKTRHRNENLPLNRN